MFRLTLLAFFVCCSLCSSAVGNSYYIVLSDWMILSYKRQQMVMAYCKGIILAPAWRNRRNSWKTSEYNVNMASPKYLSDVLLLQPACSVNLTYKICEKTRNVCKIGYGSLKRDHLLTKSQQKDVNWTELAQDRVSWWPLVTRLLNIYFYKSRTFLRQMSTAVTM